MIKKVMAVVLVLAAAAAGAAGFLSRPDYPQGIIYNYMEHHTSVINVLSLDDYVVYLSTAKLLSVYDKKTGDSRVLAADAFDRALVSNRFLIAASGNTLYYISQDSRSSGSAFYAFDLDRVQRTAIKRSNPVGNYSAFLGMDTVFGIKTPSNDIMVRMAARGAYVVCDRGFLSMKELAALLSRYDKSDEYFIPDPVEKAASDGRTVFFINRYNELIGCELGSMTFFRLNDRRVSDFFITGDEVYYYTLSGEAFRCGYDLTGSVSAGIPSAASVRVRPSGVYYRDSSGSVLKNTDRI